MTIENKGPGGIGNNYGTRETKLPSLINDLRPKDIYTGMSDHFEPKIVKVVNSVAEIQDKHDELVSLGGGALYLSHVGFDLI